MRALSANSTTFLKDLLYNLTYKSGASDEYCRGLVVGAVCAIMATESITHVEAIEVIKTHLPDEPYRQLPEVFFME